MPPPRRSALASPSDSFAEKKAKILSQLAVPDAEYTDLSPKGSVDEGIRDLIAEINEIDGLVTTSSCAGRVSVFLEGVKKEDGGKDGQVAAVGGKGAGGAWLFVSHDPVHDGQEETRDWKRIFGLSEETFEGDTSGARRFIHFKFEPLVSPLPRHHYLVNLVVLTILDIAHIYSHPTACPARPALRTHSRLPRVWRPQHHPRNVKYVGDDSNGGHQIDGSRL